MDTVVGGRGDSHACLLVLSERLTRRERILKLKSRSQKEVIKALDKLEKQLGTRTFRETFRTITMDNGQWAGVFRHCRDRDLLPAKGKTAPDNYLLLSPLLLLGTGNQ